MDINKNHTTDGDDGVILFQGIAILKFENGMEYDAAITIKVQAISNLARWFGSFEWMGVRPVKDMDHVAATIILSDGREGTITVPYAVAADESVSFLGQGLPPGFVYQGEELDGVVSDPSKADGVAHFPAKPASKTRVAMYYLTSAVSIGLMVAALWVDDHALSLVGTGFIVGILAGHFRPNRQTR